MTLTRRTRRLAAVAAVAVTSGAGALALAGPAAAYTPCPEDICPTPVVDTTKIKWPIPVCLSCPEPYLTIKDIYIKEELGRELVLEPKLAEIAELPLSVRP